MNNTDIVLFGMWILIAIGNLFPFNLRSIIVSLLVFTLILQRLQMINIREVNLKRTGEEK